MTMRADLLPAPLHSLIGVVLVGGTNSWTTSITCTSSWFTRLLIIMVRSYTYISIDRKCTIWWYCVVLVGLGRQTLESRFFTHLPGSYTPTILMLEKSLQRAFLVKAIKTGHMDKVTEFFARYSHELTKPGSDWEPWFGMPISMTWYHSWLAHL